MYFISASLYVGRTAPVQIDIYTKKFIQSDMASQVSAASAVEEVYRSDWGRIVATLIGLLGDFDLAEEYAQEAFAAALEQWPASGVPDLPRAWIIQTARHKAIDRLRRRTLFAEKIQPQLARDYTGYTPAKEYQSSEIQDERLASEVVAELYGLAGFVGKGEIGGDLGVEALLDAVDFDNNGVMVGQVRTGGNGGLISMATTKAADALRLTLDATTRQLEERG